MAQAPSVTGVTLSWSGRCKPLGLATVAFRIAIAGAVLQTGAVGQQPAVGQRVIAAIKAEALRTSEATKLFHTLTDTFGPLSSDFVNRCLGSYCFGFDSVSGTPAAAINFFSNAAVSWCRSIRFPPRLLPPALPRAESTGVLPLASFASSLAP